MEEKAEENIFNWVIGWTLVSEHKTRCFSVRSVRTSSDLSFLSYGHLWVHLHSQVISLRVDSPGPNISDSFSSWCLVPMAFAVYGVGNAKHRGCDVFTASWQTQIIYTSEETRTTAEKWTVSERRSYLNTKLCTNTHRLTLDVGRH